MAGAPEFTSIDEIFAYLSENCDLYNGGWPGDSTGTGGGWWPPFPGDSTGFETPTIDEILAQLEAQGFGECLAGAPEFTSIDEIYTYLYDNCDIFNDDITWDLEDELEWLSDNGFAECLEGAPEFESIEALYGYLYDNCDAFAGGGTPIDSNVVVIPDCLAAMPSDINTVQGYILYISANCGSEYLSDIPECYLEAPVFATDAEFFAWVAANCNEGLAPITTDGSTIMHQYYMAQNSDAIAESASGISSTISIQMSVSPNPASDMVQINVPDIISSYALYDLTGRLVTQQSNLNGQYTATLSVNGLAQGMYVLKVHTYNGKIAVQKLIVK